MNFKFFFLLIFILILQSCGVKAKPDSFKENAIPSYVNSYTNDTEYELVNPKVNK